ncbi:MAG: helix-turn-helix transcriptional regulator [Caldilineaceae bacterium]|nr:helix-turn-helix transcriptional regulator [Caldilineaceae bacterium]
MTVQVIEKEGQPEWAVIPYHQYEQMIDALELLEDIRSIDEAKMRIALGEELIPSEVTYAILDGANPIRVWRDYRGLTQAQVAERAGISTPYLSQLESGKRTGTTAVLQAIAAVLDVDLEDLVS